MKDAKVVVNLSLDLKGLGGDLYAEWFYQGGDLGLEKKK
jgi:hypothetical protein